MNKVTRRKTPYLLGLFAGFGVFFASAIPAQSQDDLIVQLESLAEADNAEAIYHIGMAYHLGIGVKQDPSRALQAFEEAADLGDPLAAYKLGCYYDGQGQGLIENDPDKALAWKLVAAEAGYALAQNDVALLYYKSGKPDVAVTWLERAANQGWSSAVATYSAVHNGTQGIDKNPVITAAYFQIFLQMQDDTSDKQEKWFKKFQDKLTREQRVEAEEIVETYQPLPTPLTLKALSGREAARKLVRLRD